VLLLKSVLLKKVFEITLLYNQKIGKNYRAPDTTPRDGVWGVFKIFVSRT